MAIFNPKGKYPIGQSVVESFEEFNKGEGRGSVTINVAKKGRYPVVDAIFGTFDDAVEYITGVKRKAEGGDRPKAEPPPAPAPGGPFPTDFGYDTKDSMAYRDLAKLAEQHPMIAKYADRVVFGERQYMMNRRRSIGYEDGFNIEAVNDLSAENLKRVLFHEIAALELFKGRTRVKGDHEAEHDEINRYAEYLMRDDRGIVH